MSRVGRRIVVSGRVQGVFYRNWTVETARALGIAGRVRNLSTGEVEILAEGDGDSVAELIERCRSGPTAARVDDVAVSAAEAQGFQGFEKWKSA